MTTIFQDLYTANQRALAGVCSAAITDASTIATDCSQGTYFTVTLAGNRTLGAPTNLVDGQTYYWEVTQDGTGSRTLAYNAIFQWAATDNHTLSTAAGSVDLIRGVYSATSAKIKAALSKAYS